MAYLWCTECGEKKKERFENTTRFEGESIVLSEGALWEGDYRCDQCNQPLFGGDYAMLCEFLPAGYQPNPILIVEYFDGDTVTQKTYSD